MAAGFYRGAAFPMKITAIETIHLTRGITVHAGPVQWLWVRIHTDSGLTGLGETYPRPDAEKAVVRALAPLLIGRNPLAIDRLWADMFQAIAYSGWAGSEMRAISALDIALWDLAGKAAGVPVYQLLGGPSRSSIRIYNTCYDDRVSFLEQPVQLARQLMDAGIRAMKIWPFDPAAQLSNGQYILAEPLRRSIEPLRLIREEFGDSMEVALEFHGYWNLPSAIRIAQALEPYSPMWLEEMLPQDNLAAYRELADATRLPLCISERLMTRWGFRELLENRAARIIMPDLCWGGGISEAKKIATMAEAYYLPVAPHNCGGPVLHFASAHLAANLTNLFILETVRRHYLESFQDLVTDMLVPENGELPLPPGPGLGIDLAPGIADRPDAVVERIT
jgi:L-alanine-DL-glutamate epimerase-like enolase superfamily enzyme